MGLKLGGMMHSTMKQIAIQKGYANFCAFHRTLKCSKIGMGQVWGMMTHIRKRE